MRMRSCAATSLRVLFPKKPRELNAVCTLVYYANDLKLSINRLIVALKLARRYSSEALNKLFTASAELSRMIRLLIVGKV